MAMGAGGGMYDGMMMPPPPSSPMPMPAGNDDGMHMPMPAGNDDGMHMPMGGGAMMHMTFFWGHRVDILFSGWPGDRGVGVYILALLAVFVAAALVECLSYVPHRLFSSPRDEKSLSNGLALTVTAAVRTGLSYLVMLAVMSFNIGVLIVAIAGHALGFFVFGSNTLFRWSSRAVAGGAQPDGHHAAVLPNKC